MEIENKPERRVRGDKRQCAKTAGLEHKEISVTLNSQCLQILDRLLTKMVIRNEGSLQQVFKETKMGVS